MKMRKKVGIILILVGIGIPLVLFFLKTDDDYFRFVRTPSFNTQVAFYEEKALDAFVNLNKAIDSFSVAVEKKSKHGLTDEEMNLLDAIYDVKEKVSKVYSALGIVLEDNGTISLPNGRKIEIPGWGPSELPPPQTLLLIPYKYSIGLGCLFLLCGAAFILFSFFPRKGAERLPSYAKTVEKKRP